MNYKDTLILLNSAIGPKNDVINNLIEYFGSIEVIIDSFLEYERDLEFLSEKDKIKIKDYIISNKLDKIKSQIENKNIKIITKFDRNYPEKLKYIDNSPYLLYTRGKIEDLNSIDRNISIVGSRKATNYGKWVCEKFSKELTLKEITITSGMALGIDSIAHRTCISNNGSTVAVLGSGVDTVYPKRNKKLYEEIMIDGLIVSEFPIGSTAMPYNFPVRNRIISGLSDGVLVVEASNRSGTLITATYAGEQNKEVFAVPGNIDNYLSKGTNQLIREGAKITTGIEDILEEFNWSDNQKNKKNLQLNYDKYEKVEVNILELLKEGSKNIIELSEKISIKQQDLLSKLTILEMQGIISQEKGKNFRLKN
ncbi:MAG: DNA-processing protein DprA [Bacillota bacterium]|nr:DNA-processing protein DprA [Bacillota bacterium]